MDLANIENFAKFWEVLGRRLQMNWFESPDKKAENNSIPGLGNPKVCNRFGESGYVSNYGEILLRLSKHSHSIKAANLATAKIATLCKRFDSIKCVDLRTLRAMTEGELDLRFVKFAKTAIVCISGHCFFFSVITHITDLKYSITM